MLDNAIVAAGGYGTRLKGYKNPRNCKSLITDDNNITLLEHTLRQLKEAQVVKRVLLISRNEIKNDIENIVKRVAIDYKFFDDNEIGVRGVRYMPVACKKELNNKPFLIMCGHAPIPKKHLQKMLSIHNKYKKEVVSLYKDRHETENYLLRIKVNKSNLIKSVSENLQMDFDFFVESPFILNPDIIKLIEKDESKNWLGFYIKQQIKQGVTIYGVKTNFSSEADTPDALDRTLLEIKKYK